MKITNEIKIGIIVTVTLIAFIWLFSFLKGKNFLNRSVYYYSIYDNVGGLTESSPVEVNGYKVGVVQSINFIDQTSGKLLVTFSVNRGFKIPKNTVAEIKPVSIIAGMKVQFIYGEGSGFYSYGDTLPGKLNESILTTIEDDAPVLIDKVLSLITTLDSAIHAVDKLIDDDFTHDMEQIADNLNSTSTSLHNIIASKEDKLKRTIDDLSEFSNMLSENNENLNRTIANLRTISDSLSAGDLYGTISNLKSTLEGTTALIENVNSGQGNMGQIFTDRLLYDNINNTIQSLNILLRDLNDHPKRYVHFSVFGKKDKNKK